jgi:hypothetical protein
MKDRTTQSDPWGHGIDVERLADRLDELADYVTQGFDCVRRNFSMRVPAEPYHDADLVISAAARLLRDGLVTPPSPAQPAAWPVNLAELRNPDFSDGLTASQHLDVLRGGPDPRAAATASAGPPEPDADHILRLAAIIREVDGKHELGVTILAEQILAHPGFSGCHDGHAALPAPAQGEVDELIAAPEADAECVAAEQPDLMQLTDKQLTRIAELLKARPALLAPGFQIGPQEYIPHA